MVTDEKPRFPNEASNVEIETSSRINPFSSVVNRCGSQNTVTAPNAAPRYENIALLVACFSIIPNYFICFDLKYSARKKSASESISTECSLDMMLAIVSSLIKPLFFNR